MLGVRFFSLDYLKEQLQLIINSGVKTIKLLDRSFNAKTSHALAILEFVFKNAKPGMQFQFEINGDVLDQKIIDYINDYAPDGLLRFEIGIQSTYDPTNEIVRRYQDFNRLSEVIRQLQSNHKIDFHLDLIAGLPLENLSRFAKSFDDVFAFRPKELQLGFLKLLRGTSLRNDAKDYGYVYQKEPPYEMLEKQKVPYRLQKLLFRMSASEAILHNFAEIPALSEFFLYSCICLHHCIQPIRKPDPADAGGSHTPASAALWLL